jgi:glycerophosphoryl diester phosphodiesterase
LKLLRGFILLLSKAAWSLFLWPKLCVSNFKICSNFIISIIKFELHDFEFALKASDRRTIKIVGQAKYTGFRILKGNLRRMLKLKSNNNFKTPWIIGHRGYPAKYPENTLIAFQAAIAAGATMLELDVMLSRDRKVVVIHDATLERTTNGHGAVSDFTMAELKSLDAGSWFDKGFAGQQLPELSEVLDLVDGRAYVNIEIKSNAYESHHPPDAVEKQVVELLRKKNLLDICMISSFDVNVLEQIASMEEAPAIAFISKKPASKQIVETCTRLDVFSWHPKYKIITRKQVDMMHANGIKVFPYNVDTLEDYIRVRDMKVDGVITNDPALAGYWTGIKKAA